MSWVGVTKFIKTDKNKEKLQEHLKNIRDHWHELALDLGLDPVKNVRVRENDKAAQIEISETFDMALRDEHGEWMGPEPVA